MVGEVFERDSAQTAFFQGGKTGWDGIDTKLPCSFRFQIMANFAGSFHGQKTGACVARRFEIRRTLSEYQ